MTWVAVLAAVIGWGLYTFESLKRKYDGEAHERVREGMTKALLARWDEIQRLKQVVWLKEEELRGLDQLLSHSRDPVLVREHLRRLLSHSTPGDAAGLPDKTAAGHEGP